MRSDNLIIKEDIKVIISNKLPWQKLANMTFLISGASGFIASYIVKTLLTLGNIRVIGVVRDKKKGEKRFDNYKGNLKLVVGDVSRPLTVREKVDYIIHAASPASPQAYCLDPAGTLKANVLGTYHLLELARAKQAKGFLLISSGEIYGQMTKEQIPIKETSYGFTDPTNIRSCYSEAKRVAETMAVSWHSQYGVPTKIARVFHTYGPGMKLADGRVFSDFVANVVEGKNIVMKSQGKVRRPFCYVADTVAALLTILLKGEPGQAYNVGNDQAEISVEGLANLLVNLFPERKLKVTKKERKQKEGYIETKILSNRPNTSKLRALGWQPKYNLAQGFKRTINSYINQSERRDK